MGTVCGGACYTWLTAIVASGAARRVVLDDFRVIDYGVGEIRRIVAEIAILASYVLMSWKRSRTTYV